MPSYFKMGAGGILASWSLGAFSPPLPGGHCESRSIVPPQTKPFPGTALGSPCSPSSGNRRAFPEKGCVTCGSISQRNVNRPRGCDLPKLLASRDSTRSSECQVSSLLFRALPCLRWCISKCGLVMDQPSNGNTVDVNEGAAKTNTHPPKPLLLFSKYHTRHSGA